MDPIREFLKLQDYSDHVIRDGLEGLVQAWERTARTVSVEYDGMWEEWLNEVDGREIIHEVAHLTEGPDHSAFRMRIAKADELFKLATEMSECQWGAENEREHGWNRDRNWWYYRKPLRPGPHWTT